MHRILLASLFISSAAFAQTGPLDGTSLAAISFRSGSTRLTDSERSELRTAARWHAQHPDSILIVEGHSAREGSWTRNLRVSQRRTEVVRDALVAAGADRTRIVLAAHGDDPDARSRADAGRVEVRANRELVDLAREQRDIEVGEDARARQTLDQRRTTAPVRGRDLDTDADIAPPAPPAGNTTIVIVPPTVTVPSSPGD